MAFDTETTLDPGQGLRVGSYQLRQRRRLREEGLFYDPDALTAAELRTLQRYASIHGLRLLTQAEFVEDVFLRTAWNRRGLIVGHNLPFDLSRISIANRPAQSRDKSMRGGFSLQLSPDPKKSHIQIKRINAGGAFIRLTIPAGISPEKRNQNRGGQTPSHHGNFFDTATLGGALFGGRPSLKHLGKLLQTDTQKAGAEHGKRLTSRYLDYLRTDVQVTWERAIKLRERYDEYQLPKQVWQIYSEASIGKAHLEKLEIAPFLQTTTWPHRITATVMESYYGGRTECRIRRTAVPGVYVDFNSQYPTVYCLQQLQRYLIAENIEWRYEPPDDTQALLDRISAEDVLDPGLWPTLDRLVLVAPDGDRLPTRMRYARRSKPGSRKTPRSLNVGLPYRYGGPPQWYTLADCISSKLETGKAPRVVEVLAFKAGEPQSDLAAIDIAGDRKYRVDPQRQDVIGRLVELRTDVRKRGETVKRAGDHASEATFAAVAQAMKATANSAAYGSPIELNPIEHRKKTRLLVHLPDGTSYLTPVDRTEQTGKWFCPLIATLVAAGGRLLLATAMRLVADQQGHYAFCDTDSLFIVATKKGWTVPCRNGRLDRDCQPAIASLTWTNVETIVDRFASLNPYPKLKGSILQIEDENYYPGTSTQREIECFAIASKRYSLLARDNAGRPRLLRVGKKVKRSEHGLGHLLSPYPPLPDGNPDPWMDEWWQHLLDTELGYPQPEPTWFDDPAIGRITATSTSDIKTFARYNHGKDYRHQIKPWGFLCLAHPAPHERARPNGVGSLIAPFERDPKRRRNMSWIDRNDPATGARAIRTRDDREVIDGVTAVLSYRDYFDAYRRHPESKAADPSDGKPCHPWTRGLLTPRAVTATRLVRIGKESNRLADTGLADDDFGSGVIEYPPATRPCLGCDRQVAGRRRWCSEACRKRAARRG